MSNNAGTVKLHRVLRAPAERVYKAFTDQSALEYWSPPYGFTGTIHEIDVREGGGYRMSFTNFSTGSSHTFAVKYLELVPNQRIRSTDRFDDDNLPGEMVVTVDLKNSVMRNGATHCAGRNPLSHPRRDVLFGLARIA